MNIDEICKAVEGHKDLGPGELTKLLYELALVVRGMADKETSGVDSAVEAAADMQAEPAWEAISKECGTKPAAWARALADVIYKRYSLTPDQVMLASWFQCAMLAMAGFKRRQAEAEKASKNATNDFLHSQFIAIKKLQDEHERNLTAALGLEPGEQTMSWMIGQVAKLQKEYNHQARAHVKDLDDQYAKYQRVNEAYLAIVGRLSAALGSHVDEDTLLAEIERRLADRDNAVKRANDARSLLVSDVADALGWSSGQAWWDMVQRIKILVQVDKDALVLRDAYNELCKRLANSAGVQFSNQSGEWLASEVERVMRVLDASLQESRFEVKNLQEDSARARAERDNANAIKAAWETTIKSMEQELDKARSALADQAVQIAELRSLTEGDGK